MKEHTNNYYNKLQPLITIEMKGHDLE